MKKLFRSLGKPWFLTLLGVLALALLVWFLGPLFGFADSYPLEETRPRWILIGCLFGIWALVQAWKAIAARRKNRQMTEQMAAAPEPEPDAAEVASGEELETLRGRFGEAMAVLKQADTKGRLGGTYVYQLPWYLIIGPPGCGKTTALINSGLRFPLAERFGQDPIRGVGGTRNCDWWFSDEAVLLDTAGRYTTQDSHEVVDSAAWLGFLALLKKHRPRRPINGVLVAVSLADLMQQTVTERTLQARAVKQRVQELHQHLGVRFPMYVLFMKGDLIAGFMEVFGDLGQEDREQVWGMTFHLDAHTGATDGIAEFSREFDRLEGRLNEQLLGRLQQERDLKKRALIFAFSQQLAALKEVVDGFLRDVFQPSRYEEHPLVRGVYFTSGTQTGAPIDRVMGVLVANLGLDRQAASAFTGSGKGFFINRLFRDLILREAGLAGTDLRLERHRRWVQRGAYAAAIGITAIAAAAWLTSYLRNQAYIEEVAARTHAIQVQIDGLQPQEQREPLRFLPLLNAMRDIPGGYADDRVPLSARFGLSQHGKLGEAARDGYIRALEKTLLSAVILGLEDQIRRLFAEPDKLYEALRVYLMLYDDAHYDAETVRAWANGYWKHNWPREIPVEQHADLQRHLKALFTQEPLAYRPHEMDQGLVERARAVLNRPLPAERVFSRLQQTGVGDKFPDFIVSRAAGPYADQVLERKSGQALATGIDALYTYDAYHQGFRPRVSKLIATLENERWVLGTGVSLADKMALLGDVRGLYLQEYIRQWRALLDDLALRGGRGPRETAAILGLLSDKRDSPLLLLFRAIVRETDLARREAEQEAQAGRIEAAVDYVQRRAGRIGRLWEDAERIESAGSRRPKEPPEHIVSAAFSDLHDLVDTEGGKVSELESVLDQLHPLYVYMNNYADRVGKGPKLLEIFKQQESKEADAVVRAAQSLPGPLGSWLDNLARDSKNMVSGEVQAELNRLWKAEVLPLCRRATRSRYPFRPAGTAEIPLKDFGQLFGPNGDLDRFFKENFSGAVDTTGDPWRWVGDDQRRISADALAQFQLAAAIRAAFFPAGGSDLTVEFKLEAVSMDDRAKQFILDLEGQVVTFRHEAGRSWRLKWPVPEGTGRVRLSFLDLIDEEYSVTEQGPWAWFRILDRSVLKRISDERYRVTFRIDNGLRVTFDLDALSVRNPFGVTELRNFRCPVRL
ncbi:type VI secretion system membrane subunit TssM [Candidatus Thiosymbion oneisti]|uniref:type VI secretion system membrane subunit TssM n=1 Tax=Candidatus Thiosymbion oneisti TaxID=589554 RepID=UPI000AA8496B|nr:type VI secretion system membrane subunit TssM [Candidatus Thiosymbion oneisti]